MTSVTSMTAMATPLVKTCGNCTRIQGGQSCRQFPDCQAGYRVGWKGMARIARMPDVSSGSIRVSPSHSDASYPSACLGIAKS